MNTEIIKGWRNGVEEYRVYLNSNNIGHFKTYEEAFQHCEKLKQMFKEKASIADDEQIAD
jgi:hypothetical protein